MLYTRVPKTAHLKVAATAFKNQNKYTIKGETDHQPRLDAWDGCSGLVHWEAPEGWDGEGGGRGDQDGEHMSIHGWFMSMYGKNHYSIVKKLASN